MPGKWSPSVSVAGCHRPASAWPAPHGPHEASAASAASASALARAGTSAEAALQRHPGPCPRNRGFSGCASVALQARSTGRPSAALQSSLRSTSGRLCACASPNASPNRSRSSNWYLQQGEGIKRLLRPSRRKKLHLLSCVHVCLSATELATQTPTQTQKKLRGGSPNECLPGAQEGRGGACASQATWRNSRV